MPCQAKCGNRRDLEDHGAGDDHERDQRRAPDSWGLSQLLEAGFDQSAVAVGAGRHDDPHEVERAEVDVRRDDGPLGLLPQACWTTDNHPARWGHRRRTAPRLGFPR